MSTLATQIEFFCGTGGVGKTTLATARAYNLARREHSVLLITIDPARRLKQLLNLTDSAIGHIVSVDKMKNGKLDAMILSSRETFTRLAKSHGQTSILKNNIINIITKPFAGLNEIMALIEINEQYQSARYQHIIIDTPPGQHFFDFLASAKKINKFFNKTYVEIFKNIGRSESSQGLFKAPKKLLQKAIQSGLDKVLSALESVTGLHFMNNFIDAIKGIYLLKNSFVEAISLEQKLADPQICQTFLVTSLEQLKTQQALNNFQQNKFLYPGSVILIVNKTQKELWEQWQAKQPSADLPPLIKEYKEKIMSNEIKMCQQLSDIFPNQLYFSEMIEDDSSEQINKLAQGWDSYAL